MQVLTILSLVVTSLAAFAGVAVLLPYFARSVHRHKLWELRDDIIDAHLDGRLPMQGAVVDLLNVIARTIRAPHRYTMASLVASAAAFPGEFRHHMAQTTPERLAEREFEMAGFDGAERALYDKFDRRLMRLTARHLVFGAPSGWLLTFPFGLWVGVIAIHESRSRRFRPAPSTIANRVALEMSLPAYLDQFTDRKNRQSQPLSHCT